MIADIPEEWQRVVCRCARIIFHGNLRLPPARSYRDDIKTFTCTACGKPDKLSLFRCSKCLAIFLKDFAHPLWRITDPNCFVCLEEDTSRATQIVVGNLSKASKESKKVRPQLRRLYLKITNPELFNGEFEFRI